MGRDLSTPLTEDETSWLGADLGDVVDLDLGSPKGREAGIRGPVVVVTAQEILNESAKGCRSFR